MAFPAVGVSRTKVPVPVRSFTLVMKGGRLITATGSDVVEVTGIAVDAVMGSGLFAMTETVAVFTTGSGLGAAMFMV